MKNTISLILFVLVLLSIPKLAGAAENNTVTDRENSETSTNHEPFEITELLARHFLGKHLWITALPPELVDENAETFPSTFLNLIEPSFEEFSDNGFVNQDLASSPTLHWRKNHTDTINFGDEEQHLWVVLDLMTNDEYFSDSLIEFTGISHSAWFYYNNDGKLIQHNDNYQLVRAGRRFFDSAAVLPLSLTPNLPQRIYISLFSLPGQEHTLSLWDAEQFREARTKQNLADGAYFGLVFALLLYNIFLFYATKQSTYLLFSLFIIFSSVTVYLSSDIATYFGLLYNPVLSIPLVFFSAGMVNLVAAFFSISLLKIRDTHPRLYQYWMIVIALRLLNTFVLVVIASSNQTTEGVAVAIVATTLTSLLEQLAYLYTLIFYWSRSPIARYWFLAITLHSWGFVLWSFLGDTQFVFGLPPRYLVQAATVVDIFLLTGLLAYNYRSEQQARNVAQKNSLENLRVSHDLQRAKSDFVATVGHDLHGPVRAISFFVQALRPEVPKPSQKNLTKIDESIITITDLLNSLMKLSSSENQGLNGEKEVTELSTLLSTLSRELETQAKRKSINLTVETQPCAVNTDRVSLSQVLRNIIDNAIKYTDKGTVSVRLIDSPSKATIIISDTGIGIPAEKLDYIFDDFYQVGQRNEDSEGVGLGLSIVARITELLGIEVTVTSEEKKGTKFELTIPKDLDNEKNEKHPLSMPPSKSAPIVKVSLNKRVLIVGDSIMLNPIEELLTGWGADVVRILESAEGHGLMDKKAFDVIIVTIEMYPHGLDALIGESSNNDGVDTNTEVSAIIVGGEHLNDPSHQERLPKNIVAIGDSVSPMMLRALLQQL